MPAAAPSLQAAANRPAVLQKGNSKQMYANGRSAKSSFSSFAGIPRVVMDSADYRSLSGSAVKLLNELAYQYRGKNKNNGNLTVAFAVLKSRGWKSRTTIEKARNELLAAHLIVCTRQGQFTNPGGTCSLFALVWAVVDDCPGKGLSISPTRKPLRLPHEFQ